MKTTIVKVNCTFAGVDPQTGRPFPVVFKPGKAYEIPEDVAKDLGAFNENGHVTAVNAKETETLAQAAPLNPSWETNRLEAKRMAKAEAERKAKQNAIKENMRLMYEGSEKR